MTDGTQPGVGNAPVVVRAATGHDVPFIIDSWVWSYWDDRRRGRDGALLSRPLFQAGQTATVERLIGRSEVAIACVPEVPDEICGYAVMEPHREVLHYVLTKRPYRGHGVCAALLSALGVPPEGAMTVSHMTRAGLAALKRHAVTYDPHAREA